MSSRICASRPNRKIPYNMSATEPSLAMTGAPMKTVSPHAVASAHNGHYELVAGRVQTHSLEAHIVDHCNLRCWGCCSLSPYLPRWCADPSDLEHDLGLARRILAPQIFKLVGGEPLLHPALDECLTVCRRSGIAPIVSLTTTGFLLPRASEYFWEARSRH